jgi:hypothetical protein
MNFISGTVPTSVGLISGLRDFSVRILFCGGCLQLRSFAHRAAPYPSKVSYNDLTGTIPTFLGDLKDLGNPIAFPTPFVWNVHFGFLTFKLYFFKQIH